MSRPSLLLVGAGGHARACIDVIESDGRYAIAGLIGLPEEVDTTVFDYSVLGTDADLAALATQIGCALITIGQIKTPEPRERTFAQLLALGVSVPTFVSPHAYVSKRARVGDGTIVLHGATVNAGATVGRNCIVNSHALVEHDSVIGDHCHLATNVAVNSGVHVGAGTFIGSGTSVRQGLTIGARCVIGMGQRVLADCADGTRLPPARSP